ncbi:Hypothetical protein SRAE_2000435700 [Strongyloides ratti]|uniref:Uncharacterized protein n=1 Tax=Strongyloides ratti TaxID=34506 RepID=A0A090MZX8_STRRB|nr:Hypothetical protein SRAE_2000435700 [Strongyloides ratti]CEF69710.1 Hypothetical protein SRAE_2000435700 [Strongyloides ratti]
MIKGDNRLCSNPVYKKETCFADVTLGCYFGLGYLIINDTKIEERYIQGCFTRKNRRSTRRDVESKYGDKGHLRIFKKIKNINFQNDVKFCFNDLCNL